MTNSIVNLTISAKAYDEIASKLTERFFDRAFTGDGVVNMNGISLTRRTNYQPDMEGDVTRPAPDSGPPDEVGTLRAEIATLREDHARWQDRCAAATYLIPGDTPISKLRDTVEHITEQRRKGANLERRVEQIEYRLGINAVREMDHG